MALIDNIDAVIRAIGGFLWGWPLIIFFVVTGVVFTIAFRGIQFRYFFTAWKYVFQSEDSGGTQGAALSPLQAFLNTLSASLGNGSFAGMSTAIYAGGPGAAFWVFLLGFISMPVRFAEVFCGTTVTTRLPNGAVRGGPMAYIAQAPGGRIITSLYVACCLLLCFVSGCAMQCQAITGGLVQVTAWPPALFAGLLFALLVYIVSGGSRRIFKLSDMIVPVKVALFFIATGIAFLMHAKGIGAALHTILRYAFTPGAMSGGVIGYTIQDAIRYGMVRTLNATEAGIGTAGILYGATGSTATIRNGIAAMVTTFISNHLVCCSLLLLMVVSGAWNSGYQGIDMTVYAYSTVFGSWGSIVVTLLSSMFGLGVLVAYVYIGRECWMYFTEGKYDTAYYAIYCLCALVGSLAKIDLVWNAIDVAVAGLLITNLYALWYMMPRIRHAVQQYQADV